MRTGIFDYKYDIAKAKCPMCKKFTNPETCGFNNTFYSFSGIKRDSIE